MLFYYVVKNIGRKYEMSDIRNLALYESGERKIQWVKANMPILSSLEKEFAQEKPFEGLRVALSVHLEAKTAYLCRVLAAGGAEMYVTGSNPLSTQDDVAAALVKGGMNVFAYHGATEEEYNEHLRRVIEIAPNIIIDDGGDLVNLIHNEYPQLIENVIGGCEETHSASIFSTTATARDRVFGTELTERQTLLLQVKRLLSQATAGAVRALQ